MKKPNGIESSALRSVGLPLLVVAPMIVIWTIVWRSGIFHESAFPAPLAVVRAFADELRTGRLYTDLITSLFRVTCGFGLAVLTGIPAGLWMGEKFMVRIAFLPIVNFFRNLSPLAWIPFAILWFGVGDASPIFLIFLSAFFPVVLATMAAAASVPAIYSRVAQEFGMGGMETLMRVTLPAIMPQVVTTLRVTAGVCWLVVVAAEMIVIGLVGVGIDRALEQLTRIPSIRWGYER